jgi:hypothetical protein
MVVEGVRRMCFVLWAPKIKNVQYNIYIYIYFLLPSCLVSHCFFDACPYAFLPEIANGHVESIFLCLFVVNYSFVNFLDVPRFHVI